jgi:cytochrome b involved in lipid metabolism
MTMKVGWEAAAAEAETQAAAGGQERADAAALEGHAPAPAARASASTTGAGGRASPAPTAAQGPRTVTQAEVAKHNTADDCWVIIDNVAYDVTKFLEDHPGGKNAITIYAGKDASKEFKMLHKPSIITKYGEEYKVGPVQTAKL